MHDREGKRVIWDAAAITGFDGAVEQVPAVGPLDFVCLGLVNPGARGGTLAIAKPWEDDLSNTSSCFIFLFDGLLDLSLQPLV